MSFSHLSKRLKLPSLTGQSNSMGASRAQQVECARAHALKPQPGVDLTRQIVDRIPVNARFVLIGEATHGTKEFYDQRSEITKLLIQERGFRAVCAEADFPDAFRVNMYVRGLGGRDSNASDALSEFQVGRVKMRKSFVDSLSWFVLPVELS
jgi:erythromycin esterase-like protein